ncbi:MAG TPA: hypothetical protein VJN19_13795 [Propionibacteriaceae bacterium]|nr:hypothetical protein [Propionibacteriaceae bacterium]
MSELLPMWDATALKRTRGMALAWWPGDQDDGEACLPGSTAG